jgi:death-on-curing protein
VQYLDTKDLLLLHHLTIEHAGGTHGLREMALLEAAVARPQASFDGQQLYPNFFSQVGALVQSLFMNHPFVDGNKRTAMLAGMTMVELHGFTFEATQEEIVSFALEIADQRLSVEKIGQWFREHAT